LERRRLLRPRLAHGRRHIEQRRTGTA
jgi:hypothetical protein